MTPLLGAATSDVELDRPDKPIGRRFSAFGHIRCECQWCGSQLNGLAIDDVLSGVCGACGGSEIVPVGG